jgi:hypothetical protein
MNMEESSMMTEEINSLINDLHNENGLVRQKARFGLTSIGHEAIPSLIDVVQNEKGQARWEAIETLSRMNAPSAVPVLIEALKDEDTGIRWAASNALIHQERAALKPLLNALVQADGYTSARFRQLSHHILHVFDNHHQLHPKETEVLEALEGPSPEAKVPWAAERALEELL